MKLTLHIPEGSPLALPNNAHAKRWMLNSMQLKEEKKGNEMKMTKKQIVTDILKEYEHDWYTEGRISKRRLWYILKPKFAAADLTGIFSKGKPVQPITNDDYNKYFNILAEAGEIDDTYILDNSRIMEVGDRLSHIVITSEKKTIEGTARRIADRLGCSMYIAGGFSSIYAAKKLEAQIRDQFNHKPITILTITDHDKSGYEISDTVRRHFGTENIHRILLKIDQVPDDRIDQFFDIDKNLGKTYELDILNVHELIEVFLSHIPSGVESEIKRSYLRKCIEDIREEEIRDAINDDEEVISISKQIDYLDNELEEVRSSLHKKYSALFDKEKPVRSRLFDLRDVYESVRICTVKTWRPQHEL